MTERRWSAAGVLLFGIVLALAGSRLRVALGPPAADRSVRGLGVDAQAAADRVRTAADPARQAAMLAQGDPMLATVLALDLGSLPMEARPAVAMAAMDPDLRDALMAEAGMSADALARTLWGAAPQGTGPLHALGSLLDHTDEGLASGAARIACTLPPSRAVEVGQQPRSGLRGQGLALVVAGCGRSRTESLAALLPLLEREGPLAAVAALELARLGDPAALDALRAVAEADPQGARGLAAAYGVAVLSESSASAIQSVPRR